ncbi:hypothetical protein GCM10010387_19140 [Streptomyces inusitatus]|uniref:Uncharacterized protein n=1 Tax=Streptomyces inusitatus TaxID=68221 RepID=A0A918UP76_9ACTN|nr:hypothetical protein GCM10010387_19140 [Streptomyces inusitatus]
MTDPLIITERRDRLVSFAPVENPGGGARPGYSPWDASRVDSPGQAVYEPLFDSPRRASHSMRHGYSFALEYARRACFGDCTSTMLFRKSVTFSDLVEVHGPVAARDDVSAGSDGVSGAGAPGSVGGRARPRGGGSGAKMGPLPAGQVRDAG